MPYAEKPTRNTRVFVRLTKAEKAELQARAERANIAVSAFIRQRTLDLPPPRRAVRPDVDSQQIARLLGQLGKIGSNINQIAAAANLDKYMRGMHEAALIDLAELRAACLEALGKQV